MTARYCFECDDIVVCRACCVRNRTADKKNLPRSDEAYGEIMVNIYYMYIVLESVIVIINFAATLIISLHAKIDRHIECPSLVLWSNNTESCFHVLILENG